MHHLIQRYARSFAFLLLLGTSLGVLTSPAMGQMNGLDIRPGVKAGGDFMTVGGDDAPDNADRRTGFLAGGFLLVDFAGPFALQPEALYVQKGWSQDIEGTSVTSTAKLDYVEIPVLAKFQLPVEGAFSPNLIAGPALGINVSAEVEAEGDGGSNTEDLSDDVSSTDFGLVVGAGSDFGVGAGTLSVDFRYGLGLSSIDDTDTDASIQNRGFMITAGFAF